MAPKVKPDARAVLTSKTLGTNGIAGVVGLLALIAGSDLIQSHPQLAMWAAALLPVANQVLRFITKQPLNIPGVTDQWTRREVPKDFWWSSTFWVNFAFLGLGIIGVLLPTELVQSYPQIASVFVSVQSGANFLLRFKTKGPLFSISDSIDRLENAG